MAWKATYAATRSLVSEAEGLEEKMTTTPCNRSVEILLVEDNPGDVRLTQEALSESRVTNKLQVARDGVEAMAFLRAEPPFENRTLPDMVLLDLNLPRKSGMEVLEEMKADPTLGQIPVVILTTSRADQDVLRSYKLHANCYVNKPVDFNEFMNVIKALDGFWLTVVTLPKNIDR
jgi:CheY-like chemotaxis protein